MIAIKIEERQCNRLLLLYAIYSLSPVADIDVKEAAYKRGLKNGKFEEAFKYLINESLIVNITAGWEYQYHLSHEGIKALEWSVLHPQKRNEQYAFPPFSELNISE